MLEVQAQVEALMTPERWEQIKRVFHAALDHGPAQRAVFLAQLCADDEPLGLEVASLLASHEQAQSFIETPASDLAAELLTEDRAGLVTGQMVGAFRIAEVLATGGMGEVYLADDTRLGRKVALKLLPSQFTVNADRVRRFEQEARAASALNHPNIVTIHEIGHSDSLHFIATEFVDGETLREHMTKMRLTLGEVLDVALQVASALQAAHEAGIVHRDTKPENIMLRRDGFVKVLDFGLAKLTSQPVGVDAQGLVQSTVQTNPGVVMGTVAYMSPEQARAEEVDARTDIWSLGVVIYEMVTGRAPFQGATPSHVIVSILESEPAPLTREADVPAELKRIIAKALSKNVAARYETAGEMVRDLKSLKEELTVESRLKQFRRLDKDDRIAVVRSERNVVLKTAQALATRTSDVAITHLTWRQYLVNGIKTHRTLAFTALTVVVCTAIGLTYFFKNRISWNLYPKTATLISASANPTPNRGTTNEEAYRYYVQGKNLFNQRNAEADKKAIENFEQAIRIDPNYARAYAGLARAYQGVVGLDQGWPRTELEKAKQAVEKALELDNTLGEAYAVRGSINWAYEWDFVAAEKDLTTAIELEPNNDTVQSRHAFLCVYSGRFEQALKEIETARAIAPGTPWHERDRGRILYYSRRYDEAIIQLTRSIELKQQSGSIWLVRSYEMKGDYSGAFEAFMKTQKDPQRIEAYRTAYETAGWQGVKRKSLEFFLLEKQKRGGHLFQIAVLYAQLGEKEQAFAFLNKLAEERWWQIVVLNVDPQLDSLRGDPRFEELLRLVRRS